MRNITKLKSSTNQIAEISARLAEFKQIIDGGQQNFLEILANRSEIKATIFWKIHLGKK